MFHKDLCCIPVKAACLVLAIINGTCSAIIVLWYVCVWAFVLMMFGSSGGLSFNIGGVRFKRDLFDSYDEGYGTFTLLMVFWYCVVPVFALLNLIFAAVLCNGISNGRPKQVKAYFWYGIVITVLAAMASVMLLCVDTKYPYSQYSEADGTTGVFWLVGCVLHSLFLVLVHQTHKKVVEETDKHFLYENLEGEQLDRAFLNTKYLIKV